MAKYVVKSTVKNNIRSFYYYRCNLVTGEYETLETAIFPGFAGEEQFLDCLTEINNKNLQHMIKNSATTYKWLMWPVYELID